MLPVLATQRSHVQRGSGLAVAPAAAAAASPDHWPAYILVVIEVVGSILRKGNALALRDSYGQPISQPLRSCMAVISS